MPVTKINLISAKQVIGILYLNNNALLELRGTSIVISRTWRNKLIVIYWASQFAPASDNGMIKTTILCSTILLYDYIYILPEYNENYKTPMLLNLHK